MNSVYSLPPRRFRFGLSFGLNQFGFRCFYRFRLLSTARLGIDKVSIAAVTNSAHVSSRGPWSVSFEVSKSFMGTHEHFSVEYPGCQIFHIGVPFISGSH